MIRSLQWSLHRVFDNRVACRLTPTVIDRRSCALPVRTFALARTGGDQGAIPTSRQIARSALVVIINVPDHVTVIAAIENLHRAAPATLFRPPYTVGCDRRRP
jgi:hypothetical protein